MPPSTKVTKGNEESKDHRTANFYDPICSDPAEFFIELQNIRDIKGGLGFDVAFLLRDDPAESFLVSKGWRLTEKGVVPPARLAGGRWVDTSEVSPRGLDNITRLIATVGED